VYPVEVTYAAGQSVAAAAVDVLTETEGNVLCFLPGVAEIRRAMTDLQAQIGGNVEVVPEMVPLHGSLDADAQDYALRPLHTAPHHRRHQHRGDLAHGAGRHRGD